MMKIQSKSNSFSSFSFTTIFKIFTLAFSFFFFISISRSLKKEVGAVPHVIMGEKISIPKDISSNLEFLVLGSWKSGTSAISLYLRRHPYCCTPDNEIHFYSKNYELGYDWYRERLHSCLDQKGAFDANNTDSSKRFIVGEKSATYLNSKMSPIRVSLDLGSTNAKFIASIRNPIMRIYSHWWMEVCKHQTNYTLFSDWLNSPKSNMHLMQGYYAPQLKRWYNLFPRNRILLILAERFYRNTKLVMDEIQSFIGLPYYEYPTDLLAPPPTPKDGSHPKCEGKIRPPMSADSFQFLRDYYMAKNEELYELLNDKYDWNDVTLENINDE